MKKIIILNHNGGRLANQLWNFISIYAYCIDKGYTCSNYCFFEYNRYFSLKALKPNILVLLYSKAYDFFYGIFPEKIVRKIFRVIYKIYTENINKNLIVYSNKKDLVSEDFYYLPPTEKESDFLCNIIKNNSKIYFDGWRFRNPVGIKKYANQIIKSIEPRGINKIKIFIDSLNKDNYFMVGVHIRHGDYKNWSNGVHYYKFEDVRRILDDFLNNFSSINNKKVLFVLCSDAQIEEQYFQGLNYCIGKGDEISDIFTLASMEIIIGSKSTYGTLAAYLGQIPFYTFSRETINWEKSDDIYLV